ncbi:UDP-N-acetylglucosamine transferase subunit ALG14 homolog isoform X2 [Sciurus carolinensis]|uniref:UDP-N-acetylglucosamine transferase subunit ALG14 homolog isoform X2 n=1 Tax=Sciurus carolinensis TaxID=30640 RepID=UPI001FB3E65A|nr:UDP-N-acetylglucosamine transferase subunit ALG14 homolog isoform X2 [Sciurus carolinensis]
MVCVLVLAAAIGAVAVVLLFRLWVVLQLQDVTPRASLNLLVVAGSGGHTTEILRLVGSLSSAYSPRHYVIADTDEMSANKINSFELDQANRDYNTMCTQYYIHRIPRSREVQQSWLSTVFTTLHSMWLSFPLVHRVKPDLSVKSIQQKVLTTMSLKPCPATSVHFHCHCHHLTSSWRVFLIFLPMEGSSQPLLWYSRKSKPGTTC